MATSNTTVTGQPAADATTDASADKKRDAGKRMTRVAARLAQVLLAGAALVSVLMGLSTGQGAPIVIGVAVTAFLLFTAAGAVGTVLGFLFGLPRGRFADQMAATTTDGTAGAGSGNAPAIPPSAHYLTNSNLIKVSDWLTTIVIGLGLVNLGSAMPALQRLAAALKAPLGGADYAGAVGICLLIAGALGGFVVMYLYTTISARGLLEESETEVDGVPALERLTLGEAQRIMSTKALQMKVDGPIDPNAVVVGQYPNAGDTVPVGTVVKVTVGAPRDSSDIGDEAVPAVPAPRPGGINPNGPATTAAPPALSGKAGSGNAAADRAGGANHDAGTAS